MLKQASLKDSDVLARAWKDKKSLLKLQRLAECACCGKPNQLIN